MTALPSEEALREMRAMWAEYARKVGRGGTNVGVEMTPDTQLALLDCAITVRELERWLRSKMHRFASVSQLIDTPEQIQVRLDGDGWHTVALDTGPDLLAALRAALAKASEVRR